MLHYSRFLNYLECQATPALSTQAIVLCDCEKTVTDKPTGSGQNAGGNAISKLKPEEIFAGGQAQPLALQIADPVLGRGGAPGQRIPCGHPASIFQPPRS